MSIVVNFATRPGLKAEAIKTAMPYLDKPETPAFIVRTAAMARAKMKPAQASTVGVTNINAETLLKTALAKDPYDPNTYVGLAQVLAAKGAFEQSWDIYDAPPGRNFDCRYGRFKNQPSGRKIEKIIPWIFFRRVEQANIPVNLNNPNIC